MRVQPRNERALAAWEDEGGSVGTILRDAGERGPARCLPVLPLGYEAQPCWGFHDRTGRFSYEFNRVYEPPNRLDKRGPTCRLDEELSYWGVTWRTFGETADERPAGRWMSYAEARKLGSARLTFTGFSSLLHMQADLPALLHLGDLGPEGLAGES